MNKERQTARRSLWRHVVWCVGLVIACPAAGYELPQYDTWIQGFVRNRTGVFLNGGHNCTPPGTPANQWVGIPGCPPGQGQNNVLDRFEQSIWLEGKKRFARNLSLTIKLRAFVDNVFDVQEGSSRWSNQRMAVTNLSNTWSLAYDDFLREAFIDYSLDEMPAEYGKIFARLGKQQVVWGKADGLRLLDLINPQDFREPLYAVFDEVRIPLWMVRLDYSLPRNILEDAGIQMVYSPMYQSDTFPPAIVSPWSFRAFDTFQTNVNALGIPVIENLFDQPVDPASNFKNSEAGARWSHWVGAFGYTLNYYYDWSNLPHAKAHVRQRIVDGTVVPQFVYKNTPDRVHRIGASFDYNVYEVPLINVSNVVLRAELLGSIDNPFYGRLNPNTFDAVYYRDTFDYVLGVDKTFFGVPLIAPTANTETLASAQLFQTYIPQAQKDGLTNPGGANLNNFKTSLTFFLLNTSMQDRLSSEALVFYSDAGEWWFRPRFAYDFTDAFRAEIGGNFFIGHTNDFIGGFARKGMQNIFIDLRYQFF
ncbi:MAG: DUF1302 family protein [Candidatus Binatia bacterium]